MSPSHEFRILALGVLGLLVCQILAPFAFIEGNRYARWCKAMGHTAGTISLVGRILGFFGSLLLMAQAAALVVGGVVIVVMWFVGGGLDELNEGRQDPYAQQPNG